MIHTQQTLSGDCPNEKDICGIGFRRHTTGIEQRGIIIIYEIGHLETCIHSVCRRVFTPARQNHFLRKLVPKIFFHFSKQEKKKLWTYLLQPPATIKQYTWNNNDQYRIIIHPKNNIRTYSLWSEILTTLCGI